MPVAKEGLNHVEPRIVEILKSVLLKILGEDGDVWGWYPNANRLDKEGKPKYAGFVFYEKRQGVGYPHYHVFGDAGDIIFKLKILEAKVSVLTSSIKTSICVRDLTAHTPVYGGASLCNPNEKGDVWAYAGSGAPELVDHLLVCNVHTGVYISMKSSIEARFRKA